MHNFTSLLTGKSKQGATVALTISPTAQNAAYQALQQDGGHQAAAVAINPKTGAILAMASVPTFNPNELTTFDGTKLNKIYNRLAHSKAQPLQNWGVTPNYPPGSSFKVVTSSAAFTRGLVASPATTVPAPQPLKLPNGNLLNNDGDETCFNGNPPIINAFALSCNTAFAKLGIKLGAPTLRNQAELFGVNKTFNIPFQVTPGSFPAASGWTDPSFAALSAIGQFDDEMSPLQEALFSAAIANGGTLMYPYMVQQVIAPGLAVIQNAAPKAYSQPVSPQVAGYVKAMMLQVTQSSFGTAHATAWPAGNWRHHDLRQDRDGGERRQQLGHQRRGLHLLRDGAEADRDRGDREGRRVRRGRGAPIAVQIIKAYAGPAMNTHCPRARTWPSRSDRAAITIGMFPAAWLPSGLVTLAAALDMQDGNVECET